VNAPARRAGAVLPEAPGRSPADPAGILGRARALAGQSRSVGTVVGLTTMSDWLPKLVAFVAMMLVARLLGAPAFALFALAQSWIGYGWAAVDLGQAGYSVRTLADRHGRAPGNGEAGAEERRLGYEIFGLYLVLAVAVTTGLVVVLLTTELGSTEAGRLVVLMTPFLVSYALLPDWWLRAGGQLGWLGAANWSSVLCFLVALALIPHGHADGYALAYGLAPLAAAAVAWWALSRRGIRPGLIVRWSAWKVHLRCSVLFAAAGAAGQIAVPLTLLGMSGAGDEAAVGAYAVGLRVAAAAAGALWLLVQNALPRVLASRRQITWTTAAAAAAPGLLGLIPFVVLWRPVLAPLLGPSYAELGGFVALGLIVLVVWGAKFVVEMGLIAAYADRSRIVMNVIAPLTVTAVLVTGLAGRGAATAPLVLLAGEATGAVIGLGLLRRSRRLNAAATTGSRRCT
jgi:O-antigen/teichoic acid export membrane protein